MLESSQQITRTPQTFHSCAKESPVQIQPRPAVPPSSGMGSTTRLLRSNTAPRSSSKNQFLAYKAAIGVELTWSDYGGLVSARYGKDEEENEL